VKSRTDKKKRKEASRPLKGHCTELLKNEYKRLLHFQYLRILDVLRSSSK
jgi:hypothetical protein